MVAVIVKVKSKNSILRYLPLILYRALSYKSTPTYASIRREIRVCNTTAGVHRAALIEIDEGRVAHRAPRDYTVLSSYFVETVLFSILFLSFFIFEMKLAALDRLLLLLK